MCISICLYLQDHCVSNNFMVLEENDSENSPPIPPPRPKRRNRTKLKNLSLERNNSLQEDSHQNDILFQTESPTKLKDSCLKGDKGHFPKINIYKPLNVYLGNVSVLTVTTGGLRSQWKQRWAVYNSSQCKVKLYKVLQ